MERPPVIRTAFVRTAFVRTVAFDTYFDFLYSGYLEIPAREEEVDEVVKQHLNIKKTTTEKKRCFGRFK